MYRTFTWYGHRLDAVVKWEIILRACPILGLNDCSGFYKIILDFPLLAQAVGQSDQNAVNADFLSESLWENDITFCIWSFENMW